MAGFNNILSECGFVLPKFTIFPYWDLKKGVWTSAFWSIMLNRFLKFFFRNIPLTRLICYHHLNWPDFFMNLWHCKGKKWPLDLTIFFEIGEFFLKIDNVPLAGLEESVMDQRLRVNDARTEFLCFFKKLNHSGLT